MAVEPFYDNILRIHKATMENHFQGKIILVKNAVSNRPNELMRLIQNDNNIGGQSILKNHVLREDQNEFNNKYVVRTIVFDDLVDLLPDKDDGTPYEEAIIKMDIEGFEPFALEKAEKFFQKIEVQVVFMEWANLKHDQEKSVLEMIDFLYEYNLRPYDDKNSALSQSDWKNWPYDIIWKHKKLKS